MQKYVHGTVGKGTFTFLGGHDPEDYRHLVGEGKNADESRSAQTFARGTV